ncbi:MAG TPA: dipeptidase [Terriglobales bacterium]|jgi:acetylornithine deacetylase/succinyl-diaminopimelate desuccinylase-like protein|nr:dipeptidase [Terriglobales bacterium]
MSSPAVEYARQNQPRFLAELKDLLRIPSVSTLPQHKSDIERAADFLAAQMRAIGLEHVEVIKTAGHPLVYADWLHATGKPTALCYGHYDVQPPDPLNEWTTPPFEPTERNQNLYARGAVDDKGQMFMHLKALESLMKSGGSKLPINVRLLLEGEEEVGGEAIAKYVKENPQKLKADFALVSDTEMYAPDLPTLCVGLRGLVYTEVEARGAKVDLHSGMYGGAAPNPFVALAQIIAKLKDENGRILIPGFYDRVTTPSTDELRSWKSLPFDEKDYLEHEVGSTELTGESGYSVAERTWARPSMDVHGMPGGFIGAGAKTVIPSKASAKISMRLVPNQNPEEIFKLYLDYVKSITPRGIQISIRLLSGADPMLIRTDNHYVQAAKDAMKEVFGKDTVFIRSGGSIPVVADFEKHLHIPSVMMGFGLPDDNLHAPNEKFHIPNFYRGIESIIRFFQLLSR